MTSSQCTSCGLSDDLCQCPQQIPKTPHCCCLFFQFYFTITVILFLFMYMIMGIQRLPHANDSCYLDVFANSVSISNANVSTANWRIDFAVRSPNTGCKISLHTINARLLRGVEVISNSSSYSFGQFVNGDKTNVLFDNVVMPEVTSGDVIWDFGIEIISGMNIPVRHGNGFVIASCPNIPVKFTTDPAGNMTGSLLGNIRRCDYKFQRSLG